MKNNQMIIKNIFTQEIYYLCKYIIIKNQQYSKSFLLSYLQNYYMVSLGGNLLIEIDEKLKKDFIVNKDNKVLYEENVDPNQMNIFQSLGGE